MKKVLLFQIGTMPYGIELQRVKSIQSVKHIVDEGAEGSNPYTRVFDDKQTSLYDLVSIFEKEAACRDPENEKLIMVETKESSMGMIVSRVDQVVSVETDRIKPLSAIFKGASPLCFPRVLKHEDALILILAPEGIEKIVQETGNPQNVTGMPDCGDAFPEAEETITLINEVAAVSDRDSIPLAGRWAQDESVQAEIDIESGSPAGKGAIAGMIPEIIDAVDIDDESQCESSSFLANLLQTDGGASSQAGSADSE